MEKMALISYHDGHGDTCLRMRSVLRTEDREGLASPGTSLSHQTNTWSPGNLWTWRSCFARGYVFIASLIQSCFLPVERRRGQGTQASCASPEHQQAARC